jgi:hypothetical protein
MSSDKPKSLAEVWGARYDDRDADELCDRWALRMAARDQAIAQPFRNFSADEIASRPDAREAANDDAKPR